MDCGQRRRLQLSRVLFLLSGVFLCSLPQLTVNPRPYEPSPVPQIGENIGEHLSGGVEEVSAPPVDPSPSPVTNHTTVSSMHVTPGSPQDTQHPAPHIKGEYPEDIFSIEDRRRGWVVLHIVGMVYMFVSLAVVCDEFFVPALGVITDRLAISDDVAGATFMAGGRSIPELVTSLAGVFVAPSTVGIGTVVGSAVYNIVFVIGMCAWFSREVLHLTWWPLVRDVSFYTLDLILLIIFFLDNVIMWWESLTLVGTYTLYVGFLKFNAQIEKAFKTSLYRQKSHFKVSTVSEAANTDGAEEDAGSEGFQVSDNEFENRNTTRDDCNTNAMGSENLKEERGEQPLSLKGPDTSRKRITHVLFLLVLFPLWLTLPDVRSQKSRRFFVVTFAGSIAWIAIFSYLLVWWAHQVSETFGIPDAVMGLTVLAAGTSLPDVILSVIVARKGLGDMVVSSAVGKNIFKVAMGLPLPWLLSSFLRGSAPVAVSSSGLSCAAVAVFLLLFCVIVSLVSCKWRMNKALGLTMLLLYVIFVALSVMLHLRIIVCPVAP